jgi:hypothetical protein
MGSRYYCRQESWQKMQNAALVGNDILSAKRSEKAGKIFLSKSSVLGEMSIFSKTQQLSPKKG